MKFLDLRPITALVLGLSASIAIASTPLGVVRGSGSFLLNASTVENNATLFEGSVVQTGKSTATLTLRGATVLMANGSKVIVKGDRAILDAGRLQLTSEDSFAADAGPVHVVPDRGAQAIVVRKGAETQVGALQGAVRVMGRDGILLARLTSGNAMSFSNFDPQQSGASLKTKMSGNITRFGDVYQITTTDGAVFDVVPCSSLKNEVEAMLRRSVGKTIELSGDVDTLRRHSANAKASLVTCEVPPVVPPVQNRSSTTQTTGQGGAGLTDGKMILIGSVVAASIAIPAAVYINRQDNTPASR